MENGRGSNEVLNKDHKTPPTYNSLTITGVERDCPLIPIIYIVLRLGTILFCIVSFVILTTTHEDELNYCDFGSEDYCWFSWKAVNSSDLAYLLAINVFVCFYSLVQLALLVKAAFIGKSLLARPTSSSSTLTLVCDKVLTYILMAGCGAGACKVANSKEKSAEYGMFACSEEFAIFCNKEAASVAMSFISFLSSAFTTGMAYFRIHKVARGAKGANSSSLPHFLPMSTISTQM